MISIIVPVYNEEACIKECLERLKPWASSGHQIIIVDGGSLDATIELTENYPVAVYQTEKGRAKQMNEGARHANGEVLLFLHADTFLPEYSEQLEQELDQESLRWGRFDVSFNPGGPVFSMIASCMNLRSRITGIATGDQAIFIHKDLFTRVNGFPDIALMEDIAISRQLLNLQNPEFPLHHVTTSSRRWKERGVCKTILLMWYLRAAYFFGVSPDRLAMLYT